MTNECRRGLIWCWVRLSPTFTSRPRPHIWFFFVNNFFFCVLWFGFDLIRVDETKKKKSLFFFDYFVMNFSFIFKKLINFQVYWFKINQKKIKSKIEKQRGGWALGQDGRGVVHELRWKGGNWITVPSENTGTNRLSNAFHGRHSDMRSNRQKNVLSHRVSLSTLLAGECKWAQGKI